MEVLAELHKILKTLIDTYGAWQTVGITFLCFLVFFLYNWYKDYKNEKAFNLVIEEKERTIQRIANEAREYKLLYFKETRGFTDEQLKTIFIENTFNNPKESRNHLESK